MSSPFGQPPISQAFARLRWRATVLVVIELMSVSMRDAWGDSPFRYDDDLSRYIDGPAPVTPYDHLKYFALDGDSLSYLSFGADGRERVETSNVGLLGFRNRQDNTYLLQRALVYADLQVRSFRLFAQAGSEVEWGRIPSALPTDVDRLDIAEAFVDYALNVPNTDAKDTLRAGRFEMSFDDGALIGLRDGPNVRQSWNGARDILETPLFKADLFDVSPVAIHSGWFDDVSTSRQSLWGTHVETKPEAWGPVSVNAFYYGSSMPMVAIWPRPSQEFTRTIGARVQTSEDAFDGSVGAIKQTGHLNSHPVRAWSSHADAGWTLRQSAWLPRIGLKLDVLSGGDNAGSVIHTFNALYPNVAFSTEATLEAPANLIQPALTADLHPTSRIGIQYKFEQLWRFSVHDAFYAAPFFPLVPPTASADRYSGSEQQLRAVYSLNRFLTLTGACVRFAPSAALRAGHAVGETFGMTEIALRL